MRVKDLIETLKKMPPDANVVINGEIVEGIEGPVKGRVKAGYHSYSFHPVEKGREQGVYFTRHSEFSDGEPGELRF